jgi:hypothetical protein
MKDWDKNYLSLVKKLFASSAQNLEGYTSPGAYNLLFLTL